MSRNDDVLFLYREELAGLLRGSSPRFSGQVASRRAELERQRRLDPPPLLGPEPDEPPLHALPRHACTDRTGPLWPAVILGVPGHSYGCFPPQSSGTGELGSYGG